MPSCKRHGVGTENGKEYTVVDIAYWFHNFPHMRFTLRPIENTMFDFGESQYMRSIVFLAVLTLLICLAILVVYLILAFVVYIFTSKLKKSDNSKTNIEKKEKTSDLNQKMKGFNLEFKLMFI